MLLAWIQVHVIQSAKVCVVWMRNENSLDSELGVSQSPPAGLPPGTLQLGLPHCTWNPKETALNIVFMLLHGGSSADKIGTRLQGQREWKFHSGACRHLKSTHQWMQLSFLSSFPSWKSPNLGARVPGSQVFTNLPAALRWIIHPRVQFPTSWMRETGLAPEHLFQTEAQCQSVDKWLRGGCCWGCWGCLWWAGGCNCLVMFMGPGLRTGSSRPLGTQLLWHRGP